MEGQGDLVSRRGFRVQGAGSGDLVSRLIMGIIRVTIWVIGVINLVTKSPDTPSRIKSTGSRDQSSTARGYCLRLMAFGLQCTHVELPATPPDSWGQGSVVFQEGFLTLVEGLEQNVVHL